MYEPRIRPVTMTDLQRRQFVQKAKADSLAYESAQLLSKGETGQAAGPMFASLETPRARCACRTSSTTMCNAESGRRVRVTARRNRGIRSPQKVRRTVGAGR